MINNELKHVWVPKLEPPIIGTVINPPLSESNFLNKPVNEKYYQKIMVDKKDLKLN